MPKNPDKIESYERSTLQLITVLSRNEERDAINRFEYNSEIHSTIEQKNFIPLHPEDLHFLIKRLGLLMIFIYEHFTFEQANLKEILSLEIKKLGQSQDLQLKNTSISY